MEPLDTVFLALGSVDFGLGLAATFLTVVFLAAVVGFLAAATVGFFSPDATFFTGAGFLAAGAAAAALAAVAGFAAAGFFSAAGFLSATFFSPEVEAPAAAAGAAAGFFSGFLSPDFPAEKVIENYDIIIS